MATALELNARDLELELAWFGQVLDARFKAYFGEEAAPLDVFAIAPPDLSASESPYARFIQHNILRLVPAGDEQPMKAPLRLSDENLGYFTIGQPRRPDFGPGFPARYIETQLIWDDLVLHPGTRRQIEEIETWLRHGETLM